MAYQTPPRATLSVELAAAEYAKAARIAARHTGRLRFVPVIVGAAAILVILSVYSAMQWRGDFIGLVLSLLIGAAGAGAAAWFIADSRRTIQQQAAADHAVFAALRLPMTVELYEDYAQVSSPCLTEKRHYALAHLLAETADMLVIVEEEGQFLTLPKRCLSESEQEFLRSVFARRYRRSRE